MFLFCSRAKFMGFSDFVATFSGRGSHYDPNQPRVPAGHRNGGQWTRGSGGETSSSAEDKRRWLDIFRRLKRARLPVAELDSDNGAIRADDEFTADDWLDPTRRWEELFRIAAEEQLRLPGMDLPEQPKQPQLPAPRQPQLPASRPSQLPQAPQPGPPRVRGGTTLGLLIGAALEQAVRLIEKYRNDNGDPDLFGKKRDPKDSTIAVMSLKGKDIFGVSSRFGDAYTPIDRGVANRLRGILNAKYPLVMEGRDNLGEMPNNAVYHAEATVLLRAARENGRTLAGEMLHVFVDREMCRDCKSVLPLVGLELGNPTVTFTDIHGVSRTMRDGKWIEGADEQ
jgi:hypothetical protein